MANDLKNISENTDYRQAQLRRLDLLSVRMELLAPCDRVLLEMRYKHDVSFEKIATLSGIRASTIAYRTNRMVARLLSDDYINIMRTKENFTRRELEISYDHFLLGLGIKAISAKRGIPRNVVRLSIMQIKNWLEKMNEGSKF